MGKKRERKREGERARELEREREREREREHGRVRGYILQVYMYVREDLLLYVHTEVGRLLSDYLCFI